MKIKNSATIIETIKKRINYFEFMISHKVSDADFTRKRKLPFVSLVLFMLNFVKSTLQKELTNFMYLFSRLECSPKKISKSAFSQSRLKLKPEAFIDLNDVLTHEFYTDNEFNTWKGFRLLSIDGTVLHLPYSEDIRNYFGFNNDPYGRRLPLARSSSLYDVLNEIIISTKIGNYHKSEYELFLSHVDKLQSKDILILDMGYNAIWLFIYILLKGSDFVIRLESKFSFVKSFLESNDSSRIIEITKCRKDSERRMEELSLKFNPFKLRLIKVELDGGEIEVLGTSLIDEKEYPTSIFKYLYFKRWGIEVNIDHLKNQVEIENFTGLTPVSVEQDYYANMFIVNLQSIIARDAKLELEKNGKKTKYEYKINKNLSLGFMKDRIVQILTSNNPKYLEELKELFKVEPVPIRKNRKFERKLYKKKKKYFINKRRAV